MEHKNEVAHEVPVQEQHTINIICPNCCEHIEISKLCPNCKIAYDKECNYCTRCGSKLINII